MQGLQQGCQQLLCVLLLVALLSQNRGVDCWIHCNYRNNERAKTPVALSVTRLRGGTLRGGVLGTFWQAPSQEPLPRTLFCCKTLKNASPLLRTRLRTLPQNPAQNFSEPFLEACVVIQPLRRAPNAS